MTEIEKIPWSGQLIAIQARIRLLRSFSERHHNYQGYVLRIKGICDNETREFLIAVGKGAHEKNRFCSDMKLSGLSVSVSNPRLETAEYYKTSQIRIKKNSSDLPTQEPPYLGIPPDLNIYRSRGHRRLDPKTYQSKCLRCIWGCKMPVDIIIDHWNSSKRKYRFETFCYGPKSCPLYKAGVTRKVPGRKGMIWEEENWVDEDATFHRGLDD